MAEVFCGTAPKQGDGYWVARIECGGGDYVAAEIYGSSPEQTLHRTIAALAGLNATPSDKGGGE